MVDQNITINIQALTASFEQAMQNAIAATKKLEAAVDKQAESVKKANEKAAKAADKAAMAQQNAQIKIAKLLGDNAALAKATYDKDLYNYKKLLDQKLISTKQYQAAQATLQRRLEEGTNDTFRRMGVAVRGFGFVAAAALTAFGAAVGKVFSDGVREAIEQEDALKRLAQAMKATGSFSQLALDDMESFADSMENATGKAGDQVLALLALAKSYGATNAEAKKVVQASLDLAAARGVEEEKAVVGLTKSLQGYSTGLQKSVPELERFTEAQLKAGAAVDFVNTTMSGAAAAQMTGFSGAVKQVENAYNNMSQSLGEIVINNPSVQRALETLAGAFNKVEEAIKNNPEKIDQFLTVLEPLSTAIDKTSSGVKYLIENLDALAKGFENYKLGLVMLTAGFGTFAIGSLIASSKIAALAATVVGAIRGFLVFSATAVSIGGVLSGLVAIVGKVAAAIAGLLTPIGWIAVAVGALAGAFYLWNKSSDKAQKSQDALGMSADEVKKKMQEQQKTIKELTGEYNKLSLEEQRKELARLEEQYSSLSKGAVGALRQMDEATQKFNNSKLDQADPALKIAAVKHAIKLSEDAEKEARARKMRADEDAARERQKKIQEDLVKIRKLRMLAEQNVAQFEADVARASSDDRLAIIKKAYGLEEAIKIQQQQRALQAEGRAAQAVQEIAKRVAEAKIKIAQDEIEKRIKIEEEYQTALKLRSQAIANLAQFEADVALTTSDRRLAVIRQAFGLEEALNVQAQQRKLASEDKTQQALVDLERRATEAELQLKKDSFKQQQELQERLFKIRQEQLAKEQDLGFQAWLNEQKLLNFKQDVYRVSKDDQLEMIRRTHGMEAALEYLHQQNLLKILKKRLETQGPMTLEAAQDLQNQINAIEKDLQDKAYDVKFKAELDKSDFEKALDKVSVSWDNLKATFSEFEFSMPEWISDIGSYISDAWNELELPEWMTDIGKGIADAFSGIGNVGKGIWDGLSGAFESVGSVLSDAWTAIQPAAEATWEGLKAAWEFGSDVAGAAWEGLLVVWKYGKMVVDGAVIAFDIAFTSLRTTVDILSGEWINKVSEAFSKVGNMPANFYNAVKDFDKVIQDLVGPAGISKSIYQITQNLEPIINQLVGNLEKFIPMIVEAIPKLVEGLVMAIEKIIPKLAEAITKIVPELARAIPKIIDAIVKALPLITKAIADSFPDLIRGLSEGLQSIFRNLPAILKPIFDALPEIVKTLMTELPKIVTSLFEAIPEVVRGIVAALPGIIEELLNGLPNLIIALVEGLAESAGTIVEVLIDELLVKGGLERIIIALIKAIPRVAWALVSATVGGLLKGVGKIGQGIAKAFSSIGKGGTLAKWGDKIRAGFSKFGNWFDKQGAAMRTSFSKFGNWFAERGKAIWNAFKQVGNWFAEQGEAIWKAFKEVGDWFGDRGRDLWNAFKAIGDWFGDRGRDIWNAFKAIGDWFGDRGRDLWQAFSAIGDWFGDRGRDIWNAFKAIGDWFGDRGRDLWNAFKAVGDWFGDRGRDIWNAFKEIGDWFGDRGRDIWNAFKKLWDSLVNIFTEAGEAIWNGFKKLWDTFVGIFKAAGEAIWNGLKALWDAAADTFKKAGSWIWDGLKAIWDGAGSVFSKAGGWILDGLKGAWDGLSSMFSRAGSWIWDGLTSLVEKGGSVFGRLGSNIWDNLKKGLDSIGNFFQKMFDAINPVNLLDKLFTIDWKGKGKIESALGIDIPWANFAQGGMVKVPGQATRPGDDIRNDVVPAMLSPGELVIPRSLTSNKQFMEGLKLLASAPDMANRLVFRYSWKDFEKDLSSLDPTADDNVWEKLDPFNKDNIWTELDPWKPDNAWEKLSDQLKGISPWQFIKDNFFGWLKQFFGFADGGFVGGVGFRDKIPAMLTPGEYVMNRRAVQDIGVSTLNQMNKGASGGFEIDYDRLAKSIASAIGPTTVEINGREIARSVRTEHNRGFRRT